VTRFVIDCDVALHLVTEEIEVAPEHELLAPTLLRSQTLSALHEAVARGELAAGEALERLERVGKLPVRLLGDAVLRRNAWKVADRLGSPTTYEAEYIALTILQGDALVTLDGDFARRAAGIVATATVDDLTA
jgi:predicted nucleic acid-binding protein